MARKKLTKKQKEKKALDKAYERYKEQYKKAKAIYNRNLTPMRNKNDFKAAYRDYIDDGYYHPIRAMVKDQRVLTDTQARVYERNLRRNIKKWEKEDNISDIQKKIIEKAKNIKMKDYFLKSGAEAAEILNIINEYDAWEIAIGS